MKSAQFAEFLKDYATLLDSNGSANEEVWAELALLFCVMPTASVKDICQMMQEITIEAEGGNLQIILDNLPILHKFLDGRAKKTFLDDLGLLSEALARHKDESLAALLTAMEAKLQTTKKTSKKPPQLRDDVVDRHLQNLERTFGKQTEFAEVFDILKSDKSVRVAEAKIIAKAFAKGTAKSKKHAFELIWLRHASLMEGRARGSATDGRTAA